MNVYYLYFRIKRVFAYVFSYTAFPLTCISCGKQSYGIALCSVCKKNFVNQAITQDKRCKRCGIHLVSEDSFCLNCRDDDSPSSNHSIEAKSTKENILKDLTSIYPIHHYVLWKKELLFAWKIANNRSLTPIFAQLIYSVLIAHYEGLPIIPVPPRPGKIKEQGWDQIDELCQVLEYMYHIKVYRLLKRVSKTEQKKQTRNERLKTIERRYVINEKAKEKIDEAVIIDDIMTTGATLENCASVLKEYGVLSIHAITIFYV